MSTAEKTDETVMDSPPSDDKEEVPEEAQPEGESKAYTDDGKAAASIEKAAEKPVPVLKELPLRQWLDETLVPVLVPALDAVARERPEDPVGFVAEYLLKHNPKDAQTEEEEGGEEEEEDGPKED